MQFPFNSSWPLVCIFFGAMLFLILLMRWQGTFFYTKDVVVRRFSILDLEIPASPIELVNIIKGLYQLPVQKKDASINALKTQLYIDFIFMPFAYGFVALLCVQVSRKMSLAAGSNIFLVFAFLQMVSWILDIIENIYLLNKIKPTVEISSPGIHKAYLIMEAIKWGLALVSTICAVAALFYFWLSGHFSTGVLKYLIIFIAEIIIFFVLSKLIFKNSPAVN